MGAKVDHRSFVIERELPGSVAHAFRFWSDHGLKRRWTACHPDWQVVEDTFDFRVDGGERLVWRMPDGTEQAMLAHFLEIAVRERIVYAYTMRRNGAPVSSSLVTVEFDGHGAGTRMTYTEQAVFADAADGDIRESGTGLGFERLAEVMAARDAATPSDARHPSPEERRP